MDTIISLLQIVLLGKMDLEVKQNIIAWSESEENDKQEVGIMWNNEVQGVGSNQGYEHIFPYYYKLELPTQIGE